MNYWFLKCILSLWPNLLMWCLCMCYFFKTHEISCHVSWEYVESMENHISLFLNYFIYYFFLFMYMFWNFLNFLVGGSSSPSCHWFLLSHSDLGQVPSLWYDVLEKSFVTHSANNQCGERIHSTIRIVGVDNFSHREHHITKTI